MAVRILQKQYRVFDEKDLVICNDYRGFWLTEKRWVPMLTLRQLKQTASMYNSVWKKPKKIRYLDIYI
jgi:hypothetical protein